MSFEFQGIEIQSLPIVSIFANSADPGEVIWSTASSGFILFASTPVYEITARKVFNRLYTC